MSYVVPVGVDDEVEMNRIDALAAPAANVLVEDFMEFLFPMLPRLAVPRPKSSWASEPFEFLVRTGAVRLL
jgi:hypothetical protein